MPSCVYRNILKLNCRPLAFTTYNTFLKKNRGLELFVILVETSWILKINSSSQSSHFFYMTKKLRQKIQYIWNEKNFQDEIESFFCF